MSHFVGDDRLALVNMLSESFDSCIAESRPMLVSLLAEAGYGKTRVIQEFYRRLQADRQPAGQYWPREFQPIARDPMRSRKFVYPEDPVPDPAAPLPWLWWGIRCDEDSSGRKVRALFNDRVQLRAHLAGLIAAAERKKDDRDLALESAGEMLGLIPGIGEVIAAVATARSLAPRLVKRLQVGLKRRQARRPSERAPEAIRTSDLESRNDIEPDLEFLRRFLGKELPLVLVVDDAHDADSMTVRFIHEVMQLSAPILVIATAWPSQLHDQAHAAREVADGKRFTFGGLHDELERLVPTRVADFTLEPLTQTDIRALIAQIAPATDPERQRALVEISGGIPLVLQLQLSAGKVSRSIRDEAITLSPQELRRLPRSYEDLIAARFSELERHEQRWLAEAAWQGPVFFPDTMSERQNADLEHLSRFVSISADGEFAVARFIETPVYAGVRSVVEDEFSDVERDDWSRSTFEVIVARAAKTPSYPKDPASQAAFCELFIRLAESDVTTGIDAPPRVLSGVAQAWSYAERELGHHAVELHAAETALEWARRIPDDCATLVSAATRFAGALRANNETARAVEASGEAAALLRTWPDASPGQVSTTLWVQAHALLQHGELDAARAVTQEAERLAIAAGADEYRVSALQARARVEDADGDNQAEAEVLLTAIEIVRAADSIDMEELIDLQSDLLDVELFGDPPAAWKALVSLAEAELGIGHWLHVYCLSSWAMALVLEGSIEEAQDVIARLEGLLPSGTDRSELILLKALLRIVQGDVSALEDAVAQLRGILEGPYRPRRDHDLRIVVDQFAAIFGVRDPAAAPPGSRHAEWMALLQSDPSAAFERLRSWLPSGGAGWSEIERSLTVGWASNGIASFLINYGKLPPNAEELVSGLRRMADAIHLPYLGTAQLEGLEDALAIIGGQEPRHRTVRGPQFLRYGHALCRAVGWWATDVRDRAEDELASARAAAKSTQARQVWLVVAAAHRTCESPAEPDVWRTIIALPGSSAERRLNDLARLGNALHRVRRWDESADVQTEAWDESRQIPGASPSLVTLIGTNLAATLESRRDAGDIDRAITIRRELLHHRDDAPGHARNLRVLSEALGDQQSEAIALARLAELESDPTKVVPLLDRLAYLLHRLEEPVLALQASVLSLRVDPRVKRGQDLPVAVTNAAALASVLHPAGAAGLEGCMRKAGLRSTLNDDIAST